jgi:peptidoglycan hydrolase-like protein with peptidoglycan-binding domain
VLRLIACVVLVLAGALVPASASTVRVALLIGNSAYERIGALPNPPRDVALLKSAFERAGFESVETVVDADRKAMIRALRAFADKAANADVAVVYFSGHGLQMAGTNYLVPVDAALATDADVADEAVTLDRVLEAMEGARRLKFVILDACRDNPFLSTMTMRRTRSVARGLSRVDPPTSETLIAFAARAGTVALDGDGENSPFATAVARRLVEPGVDVQFALRKVRDDVLAATGGQQEPFAYGSLGGNVLALAEVQEPTAGSVPGSIAQAPAAASSTPAPDPRDEEALLHLTIADGEKIQAVLAGSGRRLTQLDGIFGEDTRAALRQWQAGRGEQPTGFLTAPQKEAFLAAFHEKGPSRLPIAVRLAEEDLGSDAGPALRRAVKALSGQPIRFASVGDKTFIAVLSGSRTWAEAQSDAQAAGGTLATIASPAENAAAYALFAGDPRFLRTFSDGSRLGPWIGLARESRPNSGWKWVNGDRAAWRNWGPGQPFTSGYCANFWNTGQAEPTGDHRVVLWGAQYCYEPSYGYLMQVRGR